jgi:hypothetical protein
MVFSFSLWNVVSPLFHSASHSQSHTGQASNPPSCLAFLTNRILTKVQKKFIVSHDLSVKHKTVKFFLNKKQVQNPVVGRIVDLTPKA